MTKEELLDLRNKLQKLVENRRKLGDYDVNAAPLRESLEANLALAAHLLERMR